MARRPCKARRPPPFCWHICSCHTSAQLCSTPSHGSSSLRRYDITGVLGAGSFGIVREAVDRSTGRKCVSGASGAPALFPRAMNLTKGSSRRGGTHRRVGPKSLCVSEGPVAVKHDTHQSIRSRSDARRRKHRPDGCRLCLFKRVVGDRYACKTIPKMPKRGKATPRYLLKLQQEVDAMQQIGASFDAVYLRVSLC